MSSEALDLSANINGFFEEVVHNAAQQRSCEVTDVSVSYVGGLLADYARPDALHDQTLDRSLTLLLDEALSLRGAERFERLRTLGDGVLYVSGFFAENLERRGVAHSYVRALGAQAYQAAAGTLRTGNASGPDVFRELARKFDLFVQLLSDVARFAAGQVGTPPGGRAEPVRALDTHGLPTPGGALCTRRA